MLRILLFFLLSVLSLFGEHTFLKNDGSIVDIGTNTAPKEVQIPMEIFETTPIYSYVANEVMYTDRKYSEIGECRTDNYGDETCPLEYEECQQEYEYSSGYSGSPSITKYLTSPVNTVTYDILELKTISPTNVYYTGYTKSFPKRTVRACPPDSTTERPWLRTSFEVRTVKAGTSGSSFSLSSGAQNYYNQGIVLNAYCDAGHTHSIYATEFECSTHYSPYSNPITFLGMEGSAIVYHLDMENEISGYNKYIYPGQYGTPKCKYRSYYYSCPSGYSLYHPSITEYYCKENSCPSGYIKRNNQCEKSCPSGYYVQSTSGGFVTCRKSCPYGYKDYGSECRRYYTYYHYYCYNQVNEWGNNWIGPQNSGYDCGGSCGYNGCYCNSWNPPSNNCRRAKVACAADNSKACVISDVKSGGSQSVSFKKYRPLDKKEFSGAFKELEYGVQRNYYCGTDCTFHIDKIYAKDNTLCFRNKAGEESCEVLVDSSCSLSGEIRIPDDISGFSDVERKLLTNRNTSDNPDSVSGTYLLNQNIATQKISLGESHVDEINNTLDVPNLRDEGFSKYGRGFSLKILHFSDTKGGITFSKEPDEVTVLFNEDSILGDSNASYYIESNNKSYMIAELYWSLEENVTFECSGLCLITNPHNELGFYKTGYADKSEYSVRMLLGSGNSIVGYDPINSTKALGSIDFGECNVNGKVGFIDTVETFTSAKAIENELSFWDGFSSGAVGSIYLVPQVNSADKAEGYDYEQDLTSLLIENNFTGITTDGTLTYASYSKPFCSVEDANKVNDFAEQYGDIRFFDANGGGNIDLLKRSSLISVVGDIESSRLCMLQIDQPIDIRNMKFSSKTDSYTNVTPVYGCSPYTCVDHQCQYAFCPEGFDGNTLIEEDRAKVTVDTCVDEKCDVNEEYFPLCGNENGCASQADIFQDSSGRCVQVGCQDESVLNVETGKCETYGCKGTLKDDKCYKTLY